MPAPDAGDREANVPSPCIRNCCLDDDDVCIGCGRAISEIIGWNTASATERRAIVSRSRDRVQRRKGGAAT